MSQLVCNDKYNSPADVIISPDGLQVLVADYLSIKVYSSRDGSLIRSCSGHRDRVITLSYSADGKRWASGSSDKNVILWTSQLEGLVKYAHNEGIRCIAFNPVTNQLASCTSIDFGFWSADGRNVPKTKVNAGIIACCWSADGHTLALALESRQISLRNRGGSETVRIERNVDLPLIVGLAFAPAKNDQPQMLTAIDWDQNLLYYDHEGNETKKKQLGFDPLAIDYSTNGDYILIGGSNKKANIFTRDGIFIDSVGQMTSWVTGCKFSKIANHIVLITWNGTVTFYEMSFKIVHSLYREHYAYRDAMTDVIIKNLITEEKVRIRCCDLVKEIAIYKLNLAVMVSDKIIIFEQLQDDQNSLHYRARDRINKNFNCKLMVVSSHNLILCFDKRLQCLNFRGVIEREWLMESTIRYVRATGGPQKREGVLMGLTNGQIVQVFIDNPLPVNILQVSKSIRCLDISTGRRKLAIVDESGDCFVYDIKTKDFLYQANETGCYSNSVAWNTHFEDMMCFTGGGNLWIKTSNFASFHQQLTGFVVGFCGTKIFCLQHNAVLTINISYSSTMRFFLTQNQIKQAYQVSCLLVTEHDWEQLAFAAIDTMDIDIAMKCLSRTSNFLLLDLITRFKESRGTSRAAEFSFRGDVLAYRNQLNEAAKLYKQAGHEDKAVNLFTDMKMFDQAQELIRSGDSQFKKSLAMRKADWVNNINEPRAAAEMYLSAGETTRAIEIMGQHGWVDMIMTTVSTLDRGDRDNLTLCADLLLKHKQYFNAGEVYKKTGDVNKLAEIYVMSSQWEEAFQLASMYPNLKEAIYVPYATWCAQNDRFAEAQKAFHKAGRLDEAFKVVQQLTKNAIAEHRYEDAGHYCWTLSQQSLEAGGESPQVYHLSRLADIYFTYHKIYRSIEDPFTPYFPDTLFNMARYLFHIIPKQVPEAVSMVYVLHTLAKQGRTQGAFKLSRIVYDKLHSFHLPAKLRTQIQMGDSTVRSKPFSDAEELQPLCYRCSKLNSLHNPIGFQCNFCQEPFIVSMVSFDVLPIVQFQLEPGIEPQEVVSLIGSNVKGQQTQPQVRDQWQEEVNQDFQTLQFTDNNLDMDSSFQNSNKDQSDPFVFNVTSIGDEERSYEPIIVGRLHLARLQRSEVIVVKDMTGTKFFRDFHNEMGHTACDSCLKFFTKDEWEHHVLHSGQCPFCRAPQKLESS